MRDLSDVLYSRTAFGAKSFDPVHGPRGRRTRGRNVLFGHGRVPQINGYSRPSRRFRVHLGKAIAFYAPRPGYDEWRVFRAAIYVK